MAQFAGEYYGASIDVKADKSRPYKTAIHKTMEQVKKARDANNHRNNDVYGANRANGLLFDVQNQVETKDGWYITNAELTEASIIAKIDDRPDQEFLTLQEFLEARRHMIPSKQRDNDILIMNNYGFEPEIWYCLLEMYEKKLISKRKIEALLLEEGKLVEFIKGKIK